MKQLYFFCSIILNTLSKIFSIDFNNDINTVLKMGKTYPYYKNSILPSG